MAASPPSGFPAAVCTSRPQAEPFKEKRPHPRQGKSTGTVLALCNKGGGSRVNDSHPACVSRRPPRQRWPVARVTRLRGAYRASGGFCAQRHGTIPGGVEGRSPQEKITLSVALQWQCSTDLVPDFPVYPLCLCSRNQLALARYLELAMSSLSDIS